MANLLSTISTTGSVATSALSGIGTVASGISGLMLVTPQSVIGYQPQNINGDLSKTAPAFIFDYEGEQTISLESDITDHYVEDNTAIQDQIALKPEVITTHGFVGELNDVTPLGLGFVKTAANTLGALSAYTPGLSITALNAYNTAFQLYQVANNAKNSAVAAWSSLTGNTGESVIGANGITKTVKNQNNQQSAFQTFYGYWKNRTLFTVQTPWAVFQNMAIRTLRAIQDAETNTITDFEITFKMIRQASTLSQALYSTGRFSAQNASTTDLGVNSPAPSISLTSGLSSSMGIA